MRFFPTHAFLLRKCTSNHETKQTSQFQSDPSPNCFTIDVWNINCWLQQLIICSSVKVKKSHNIPLTRHFHYHIIFFFRWTQTIGHSSQTIHKYFPYKITCKNSRKCYLWPCNTISPLINAFYLLRYSRLRDCILWIVPLDKVARSELI